MEKYISILIGLMMSALLLGCDDNNETMYSGEASLYLNLNETQLDSMSYSFIATTENSIVVNLPVELAGYAAPYDRPFRLKVNEGKTTAVAGKHYQALQDQYVLEKGKYAVHIPITLLYTGELDSVEVKLVVDLDAAENFSVGVPYRQEATIVFSSLVPVIEQSMWDYIYSDEFGKYSKVKHRYILSELKLERLDDTLESYFARDKNLWKAYGAYMNTFFAEHEIYDENNERIEPWL